MLPEDGAFDVGDHPGSEASREAHAQLGLQVRVDEAQILRLGLGGRHQTERRRLGAHARLSSSPPRTNTAPSSWS